MDLTTKERRSAIVPIVPSPRGELPLPDQSDNPEHPSTLPQPNLNPLLNPVLAKNIGRWAEVYFTNPPEKRERALQELVRELERESPIRRDAVAPQPSPRQRDLESDKPVASMTAEVPTQGVTCRSCGYVNRPKHKFCGRCGMRIASPTVGILQEQEPRTDFPISLQSSEDPEPPIFGFESAPRWQSYRLLAGVALALVVVILGYMAWHSSERTSGASPAASPAPPPAVASPVASTPPPSTPKADTPSQTSSAPAKLEGLPEDSQLRTTATAPASAPAKINPAARIRRRFLYPLPAEMAAVVGRSLDRAPTNSPSQETSLTAENKAVVRRCRGSGKRSPSRMSRLRSSYQASICEATAFPKIASRHAFCSTRQHSRKERMPRNYCGIYELSGASDARRKNY